MDTGKYKDKHGTTRVGDALRFLAKQGKQFAPELLELAGNLTGIKALEKLGDAISGDKALSQEDKDLLIQELQYDMQLETEITKRWEADLHSDSFMSKNIRPYTLAFLLICMFVFIMLDSSLEGFKIASEWIGLLKGLLMTAVGGYFVVRSGEKMVNKFKK
jgi:hypothetical protein|tara:strand:+ start:636 stop:1118 length:483 start_codon:yes stop_codon:yes gene_type:complete